MDWARQAVRSVPFWQDTKSTNIFHGFLGVDLEKPPGKYVLRLVVQPTDGAAVNCAVACVAVMAR